MSRPSGVRRVLVVVLVLATGGAGVLLLARNRSDDAAPAAARSAPTGSQASNGGGEGGRDDGNGDAPGRDDSDGKKRQPVEGPLPIERLDFELTAPADEDLGEPHSVRAVAWYPSPKRDDGYPLVVFAHGFATEPETYESLLAELASAGFVVVAPQSRPTRSAVIVPDLDDAGEVIGEHEEYAADFQAQRDDLEVAIDDVLAGRVPSELRDAVAHGPVGVIGHSDGGIAAAAVGFNTAAGDGRVGADVVISGAYGSFPGEWFPPGSPAFLALHGDADEVNPFESSAGMFAADEGGPKYLVSILGGGHLAPLLDDSTRPSIVQLVARFFGAYLRDERAPWRTLLDQGPADEVWALIDWAD